MWRSEELDPKDQVADRADFIEDQLKVSLAPTNTSSGTEKR